MKKVKIHNRRSFLRSIGATVASVSLLPDKRFMIDRDLDQGVVYRPKAAPHSEALEGIHVSGPGFETLAPITEAAANHRCILIDPTAVVKSNSPIVFQDLFVGF